MGRVDGWVISLPERYRPLAAVHDLPPPDGIETGLLQLMAVRAAQMTGCSGCAKLHARLARCAGISPDKLDALAAWRDARCYTQREREALEWIESVAAEGADEHDGSGRGQPPIDVGHLVGRGGPL